MTNETVNNQTIDNQMGSQDTPYKFIVGIDLGTTNSAIAYVDLTRDDSKNRRIEFLNVPQLRAPGELDTLPLLPSFLYIPGPYDLPKGSVALPWDKNRNYAVGEIAREQGALVPGRLVSSAKSWLCHGGVDRTSDILPWVKDMDVEKVSPVEASARYLQHMREAWNEIIAKYREGYTLEEQMVIITVPASFDEVARELTVKAAQKAGLNRIKLMEEPLAAFYAWLYTNKDTWQEKMRLGQLVLVCDVGGGTTDFTIIALVKGENGLRFNRLSVGDHIMLGGDNIDLTIARHTEIKLFGKTGQLDTKRWHQLTNQCRKAKEQLLSDDNVKKEVDITLMGSGGKLIADTLKITITNKQIEDLILDGFFPFVPLEYTQKNSGRKGLSEWGLPYAQDTKVTSHLATFWQKSAPLLKQETGREHPYPDFLLFNGGSLTPAILRNRIQDVVQKWHQDKAENGWIPEELKNPNPELAVAIGAVNYGIARLFDGIRVGAGTPRSYYVEVAAGEADNKQDSKLRKSICLVPRSSEEGFETKLEKPSFKVLTNQPVSFHVFSSSTRLGDNIGDIADIPEDEITILPPIHTILRYGKKGEAKPLPVFLSVRLTEIGTLELWCNSQESTHNWQLQFDVRLGESRQPQSSSSNETLDTATIEQAREKINEVFNVKDGLSPDLLVKELTSTLSINKAKWPTPVIRKLTDFLLKNKQGRSFSPEHEARWLNLLGYCLRPGFGDPLDEWRIKETWKIFLEGLQFGDKYQCLSEWWILWRRIAGGLKAGQQMEICKKLSPYIQSSAANIKKSRKNHKSKSIAHDELEIWMTLASLERLETEIKEKLGKQLLKKLRFGNPCPKELWSLSRLGSRIPFHGPLDKIVSVYEVSSWINVLLAKDMETTDALAHAFVQLARITGDRERDLPQTDRDKLFAWLDKSPNAAHFKELINNPESTADHDEQDWIFGEALPLGLVVSLEK